jgi:hypothetical protein
LRRLALALCLLAPGLRAAFEDTGLGVLGARAAGLGGADLAAPPSIEALLRNPASLPETGLSAAAFGAVSEDGQASQALGLSSAFTPDLRLGLLYGRHQDPRLSPLSEQSLAAALSLELSAGLSAGLRAKFEELESPALSGPVRGFGLDLGFTQSLPYGFSLGFSMDDLVQSWPTQAWADSLPAMARLGLAWKPHRSLYFGAEHVWSRAAQLAGPELESWRLGAEWQALPFLALRLGWRDDLISEFSAGLGAKLPGLPLSAHYAAQFRAGGPAHRLSLEFSLPPAKGKLSVTALQLLRDPESGAARSARYEIGIDPSLKPRSWKFEILDGSGKVRRTLVPADGSAGGVISWDGKDEEGRRLVLDGSLHSLLSVQAESGLMTLASGTNLSHQRELAERSEMLLQDEGQARIELRPVLSEGPGAKLSHVLVQMPAAPEKNLRSWALEFNDSDAHLLRRLEGEGGLPEQVVWDGLDAQGRPVKDALGVQVKVELEKSSGEKTASSQPLFSQKAYEIAHREAKAKPVLQLASLGLPLLMDRAPLSLSDGGAERLAMQAQRQAPAPSEALLLSGTALTLDAFEDGESALGPQAEAQLKPILQTLQAKPGLTLVISGISRKNEKNHPGLANRRAMELASKLKRYGGRGLTLVLKDPEEYENTQGVRVEIR